MIAPKLRFSEFDSAWKNVTLGSLSKLVTSGSRDWAQHYSEVGGKFIRMTNLSRDRIDLLLDDMKYVDVSSNTSDGRRTSLIPGDILMSITAELGKIGLIPDSFGEAYINQHTALIRLNEGVNPRFIAQLLGTKRQNKKINKLNDAGAKAGLNLPTIKSLEIAIPESGEQKKIASFLSIVDQKIALLTKNYELLAQYKKGVMKKIFNQEIRFKDEDGQEYSGWQDFSLGQVGEIVTGKTPKTGDKDLWGGELLFVTPTDISESKFQYESARSVTKTSKLKILPKNSIMFTCIASIGKMALSAKECVTNQQINSIIPHEKFDSEYIYYALLNVVDYIKSTKSSSALPIINKTEFSKFIIGIPSAEEQQMIAKFISSIDRKIELIQSQVTLTKQYKQGLLQQMFI